MTRLVPLLLVITALALAGCARSGGGAPAPAQASSQQAAPAKPVKGQPAPPGTPLSKVQMNMSPEQVRQIMGAPTAEKSYVTAKRFIPYYYGADAGTNTEWAYKSVGRVVFGVNKYTGQTRVIRIDYDPAEDGQ